MLHAIIIDDEMNGLKSLQLLITKFVTGVKIVASTTDPVEGIELINNYRPDIVFLDIYMPNFNGFEVLERLEFRNFFLVFTTAHEEFGLQALKQSATDYLLKPVDADDLNKAISRIRARIESKQKLPDVEALLQQVDAAQNFKVPLPGRNSVEYVSPRDILYIEADSNSSIVVLTSGNPVPVSHSLKEYENLLCRKELYFNRVHNSYIINLNHVSRFIKEDGGYLVMNGLKTIPVSKQKRDEIFAIFRIR